MATIVLRPNTDDGINEWTTVCGTPHHDCVDDPGVEDPDAPDANSIFENEVGDGNQEEFGMTGVPAEAVEITSLRLYVHGTHGSGGGVVNVKYSIDGGSGWSGTLTPDLPFVGGEWGSTVTQWTGLSITPAQANALLIQLTAGTGGKVYSIYVNCIYLVATYTVFIPLKVAVESSGKQLMREY